MLFQREVYLNCVSFSAIQAPLVVFSIYFLRSGVPLSESPDHGI
jgi:hypothetical protein